MKNEKIKTIDVNAKEWFDKINGNSYFSGNIIINYGMKDQKEYNMPFQYGYGDQCLYEAKATLTANNEISGKFNGEPLWRFCRDHDIILRYNKKENCLKRELKS